MAVLEPGRGVQGKPRRALGPDRFRLALLALIAVLLGAFWTLMLVGLLQVL